MRLKEQEDLPDEIEKLFSHILSAHRIWIGRIKADPVLPPVWDRLDFHSWEEINIDLYNRTTDLLKSTALDKMITYKNTRQQLFENTFSDILYHLINHSTLHRAQVAILMRQHQMLPPQSDFIVYLRR